MRWLAGLALAFAAAQTAAAADMFLADSKRMGDGKMDIVIAETERSARTSLLEIRIGKVGSSVGSSFFIACSLRDLARVRGGFRGDVRVTGALHVVAGGQLVVGAGEDAEEGEETYTHVGLRAGEETR